MLDFKDKENQTYSAISGACLLLLLVMFGYLLFAPKPSYKRSAAKQARQEMSLKLSAQQAHERRDTAAQTISDRTWPGTAEKLTPIALARVNEYVAKAGVHLLAFRPQRSVVGKTLESIPYLVSVEGEYPKVMNFFRILDRSDKKIAVNLIQVSSADNSSDKVTGSAGLVAYVKVLPPVSAKATTPTGAGSTVTPGTSAPGGESKTSSPTPDSNKNSGVNQNG
jgi:Tfp pilus assembly protein PilO